MKKLLIGLVGLLLVGAGCSTGTTPAPTATATPAEAINEVRNVNVQPGQKIESPLTLTGEARGTWFFEANLPVTILNDQKEVVAYGHATAEGEWMTEEFVKFSGVILFPIPESETGFLAIQRDNASGLPEHDRSYLIPVKFK